MLSSKLELTTLDIKHRYGQSQATATVLFLDLCVAQVEEVRMDKPMVVVATPPGA